MKIVIATCGTRGDIQPLIALARALMRRGHQVLIAAPPEHGTWVENCGCAFRALGSDFTEMLRRYPQVHTLRPMMGFPGILRSEIRKQLSRLAAMTYGKKVTVIRNILNSIFGARHYRPKLMPLVPDRAPYLLCQAPFES